MTTVAGIAIPNGTRSPPPTSSAATAPICCSTTPDGCSCSRACVRCLTFGHACLFDVVADHSLGRPVAATPILGGGPIG